MSTHIWKSPRNTALSAGLAILLASLPFAAGHADPLAEAAGNYRIARSSHIAFSVAQVGGGGIAGDFGEFRGIFRIDGKNIGRSNVSFTLMPASVRTGEARVENFLRSDAVFDVEKFPEISFRSTGITQTGESTARIDGVLTARGKTRPAQFDASVSDRTKGKITFRVQGKILRSPYGMDVGTPIYSNVVKFDMVLQGTR